MHPRRCALLLVPSIVIATDVSVVGVLGVFVVNGSVCSGNNISIVGVCPGPQPRLPAGSCCIALPHRAPAVMGCISRTDISGSSVCQDGASDTITSTSVPTPPSPTDPPETSISFPSSSPHSTSIEPTIDPTSTVMPSISSSTQLSPLWLIAGIGLPALVALFIVHAWRRRRLSEQLSPSLRSNPSETIVAPRTQEDRPSPVNPLDMTQRSTWCPVLLTPTWMHAALPRDRCATCAKEESDDAPFEVDPRDAQRYCRGCVALGG
ncbi:Aste57867_1583 [Aphanomyces stellatus]|uniref:Aste57867_1583 protein n=1 Tax=Aphanomyces stellatus TaxID=120398 RepID=A0A485K907_9STRA|nr:hypothetical protein As57867_001582 [Aphanomyces stellatus]VFT78796.1 Aste57867_1583 [Aphanomyces stellatus]